MDIVKSIEDVLVRFLRLRNDNRDKGMMGQNSALETKVYIYIGTAESHLWFQSYDRSSDRSV